MTKRIELSLVDLSSVSGGMRWYPWDRESTNVEDRRPQSQGGPVPDDVWEQEQRDLAGETTTDDPQPGDTDAPDMPQDTGEPDGGEAGGGYDPGSDLGDSGGFDSGGADDGGAFE